VWGVSGPATTFRGGDIHAAGSNYHPPRDLQRYHWYEDEALRCPAQVLPAAQRLVVERIEARMREVQSLSRHGYGLIHNDFHQDNFHATATGLVVFDFDDACYGWFVSDIAIALYYARWRRPETMAPAEYDRHFLSHFLQGYQTANRIGTECLSQIHLFLKLRHAVMYLNHYLKWDFTRINATQRSGLDRHRWMIEHDLPMIEIDPVTDLSI
jgi:Ser/Thr protein kinase RdoA (MazF antagonist)